MAFFTLRHSLSLSSTIRRRELSEHSDHPTGREKHKSLNGAALPAKKLSYRGEQDSVIDTLLTRLTSGRLKSTACGQNIREDGIARARRETRHRPINGLEGGPTARRDCSLKKECERAAGRAERVDGAPTRVLHTCFPRGRARVIRTYSRIGTASLASF